MNKYYAGIGSRKTPESLKEVIHRISLRLKSKKYILRSGGASGADKMFEEKIDSLNKEIYLPWKGFNNSESNIYNVSNEALEIASKFHPNWVGLSRAAKLLMGRNCYQVLGENLKIPVNFIVCYTTDGKSSGGTGQALRIARFYNIKIFNLFFENAEKKLIEYTNLSKQLF